MRTSLFSFLALASAPSKGPVRTVAVWAAANEATRRRPASAANFFMRPSWIGFPSRSAYSIRRRDATRKITLLYARLPQKVASVARVTRPDLALEDAVGEDRVA